MLLIEGIGGVNSGGELLGKRLSPVGRLATGNKLGGRSPGGETLGKRLGPVGKLAIGNKVFGRVGNILLTLGGLITGGPGALGNGKDGGLPKESPSETDAMNSVGTGGREIDGREIDAVEIGGGVNDILNSGTEGTVIDKGETKGLEIDTGVIDTGVIEIGVFDIGVFDIGVIDIGVIEIGVIEIGAIDIGVNDRGVKDVGVNEDTGTASVADGTATVDTATTGTTTDPGKLTEGTTEGTTGTPKATMVARRKAQSQNL